MAKKFNLSVVISAVDKVTAPVRKSANAVRGFGKAVAKVNNRLRQMARTTGITKLAGALRKAAGKGAAFGKSVGVAALKVGALGGALILLGRQTLQAGDQLAKISRRVGVSVETLSRFQLAAERAGIPQETFARGLRNVARNAEAARRGTGESLAFFKGLDIEFRKSNGALRDTEDILKDIADRFKDAPDGPEKTVAAMRLLGEEAGPLMINMLNEGSAGLDEMAKRAEELGITISTKDAVAMEQFNDAVADVGTALQGIAQTVTLAVLPALKPLVDNTIEFVTANKEMVATKAVGFLKEVGKAAVTVFNIVRKLASIMEPFVDLIGGPGVAAFIAIAAVILGPVLVAFASFIASMVSVAVALVPVIISAAAAAGGFAALAVSVLAAVAPVLLIIAAVVALVLIFKKMNDAVQAAGGWGLVWEGFKITVQEAVDSVIQSIKDVIRWIGEASKAVSDKIGIFKFLIPGGPALDLLAKLAPDEQGNALPANTDPLNRVGQAANGEVAVKVEFENAPAGTRVRSDAAGDGVQLETEMGMNLAVQ